MTQTFTISQLSNHVGLPTKTIRFYEEKGIIRSPERAENGYRTYSQQDVATLETIRSARDLGLPISEIKKLMSGCGDKSCEHAKRDIQQQIDQYLERLTEKIAQFTKLQQKLTVLQSALRKDPQNCGVNGYCCNILGQLVESKKKHLEGGEQDMNSECPCGNCTCGEGCNC
jgi:DNA-binding transcriptional MerR regulator